MLRIRRESRGTKVGSLKRAIRTHSSTHTDTHSAHTQVSKQQIKQTWIWLQFDYEPRQVRQSKRVRERAHKQLRQHPLPHTHRTIACMQVCVPVWLCVKLVCLLVAPAATVALAAYVQPEARSLVRSFASLHLVLAPSSSASPFQLETANQNHNNNSNKLATTFWRPAASLVLSWLSNVSTRNCRAARATWKYLWWKSCEKPSPIVKCRSSKSDPIWIALTASAFLLYSFQWQLCVYFEYSHIHAAFIRHSFARFACRLPTLLMMCLRAVRVCVAC